VAELAAESTAISPTEYQQRCLAVPEQYDLLMLGGRGGAKTFALLLLIARHVAEHGSSAAVLFIRQSYIGLRDAERQARLIFYSIFGEQVIYNSQTRVWRFPNGASVEFGQLESEGSYAKFQGRSFSLVACDELTQFPDARLIDLLLSNLRAKPGIPLRYIAAGNPGGVGHAWVANRFIHNGAPDWQPFTERQTKRNLVRAPSTYRDNPHIDQDQYVASLQAAAASDPELLKAWLDNDWHIARGAYFADVISEQRVMIEPWEPGFPRRARHGSTVGGAVRFEAISGDRWEIFLSHDYGSAAPSVTYICALSPGSIAPDGRYYPRGSIVLLDELATHVPDDLNRGLRWTVPELAAEIIRLAEYWHIRPQGVADDAIFASHGSQAGSIADEFRKAGVTFWRAHKKQRVPGWHKMRTLLRQAGSPDVPGLYVSRRCKYWWATVPALARDERRPDDVDSRGPDHGADCTRYGILGFYKATVTKIGI